MQPFARGRVAFLHNGFVTGWQRGPARMLREGLGRMHVALMLVGTNLTFFPMFILGAQGMTRRIAAYPQSSGWEGLNELETAGAFVIALSAALA